MNKKELYSEYLKRLEATVQAAKDADVKFLFMDNSGNIIVPSQRKTELTSLFVMNMLRNDAFRSVVELSVKSIDFIKALTPDLQSKMRDADAEQSAGNMVDDLLRDNGFKKSENEN